ncbi:hypothetical protein FQ775_23930 [Nitratireductor mangrovi]|uniref:Uncharacterized protein n=1 Tax=Nitratireductor mangrovi TaxID=2599600 RepID=A0A6H0DZV8_9HYPH|nr:hypothetical protein [Nitratireductor mangrovi]QIS94654.1 hypothetical protein FQ775_23930 [Nitratireductor mangrovi]
MRIPFADSGTIAIAQPLRNYAIIEIPKKGIDLSLKSLDFGFTAGRVQKVLKSLNNDG